MNVMGKRPGAGWLGLLAASLVVGTASCGDVNDRLWGGTRGGEEVDPNYKEDPDDTCEDDQSDRDGDGVIDLRDNCPDTPNPGQEDADEDGVGDACDDDCTNSGDDRDDDSGDDDDGSGDDGSGDDDDDDGDDGSGGDDDDGDDGDTEVDGRRMTGGGSVFTASGMRVTHGLQLRCNEDDPRQNLQVNWDGGEHFHLLDILGATCTDDAALDEEHPVAGFDTYIATGTGKYNGELGATIELRFTDDGEPGVDDTATMTIRDADGNVVLTVSNKLDHGNHQAHPN